MFRFTGCSLRPIRTGYPVPRRTRPPYEDEPLEDGILYAYRAGPIDQPDNRALRAAFASRVPLVYFIAHQPGSYQPIYPCYVIGDDPVARVVTVSPGRMLGPPDEREPILVEDPIERRYTVRETRVRLHQARFRTRVVSAYADRCAICRLRERRLLDAAHIAGDLETRGEPVIPNGLSLCSIHHRTFDQDLVGVSPDYAVHVSRRLLEDEDGPMLPKRTAWRPDRERLAWRFERFLATSG